MYCAPLRDSHAKKRAQCETRFWAPGGFPRRHCGQNPISIPECIDAVESYTPSKVYVFRGTADDEYKFGNSRSPFHFDGTEGRGVHQVVFNTHLL